MTMLTSIVETKNKRFDTKFNKDMSKVNRPWE